LDGRLPKADEGALRAHLRTCPDCARLARRLRAQRAAVRGLVFPLPASLAAWGGAGSLGGTAAGSAAVGIGTKVAAFVAAGGLVAGAGFGVHEWQTTAGGPSAADAAKRTAPQTQSFAGLEAMLRRARSAPAPVLRQIPTPLSPAQRAARRRV